MASKNDDTKTWIIIYPAYLDGSKTVAQGRCVPQNLAVQKPTLAEITTSLRKLGFLFAEEPDKAYSRDPVMEVGRVRVQLKKDQSPVNPEIPNRTTLYKKVAEIIPTLPSRAAAAKKAGGPKKGKK